MKTWLPTLLTTLLPPFIIQAPPQLLPWMPIAKHAPAPVERVITGSVIPSHLIAELLWEESRFQERVVRLERNKTCSRGILQKNRPCDAAWTPEADLREGLAIAEKFWSGSGGNWARTKRAYRVGHLSRSGF